MVVFFPPLQKCDKKVRIRKKLYKKRFPVMDRQRKGPGFFFQGLLHFCMNNFVARMFVHFFSMCKFSDNRLSASGLGNLIISSLFRLVRPILEVEPPTEDTPNRRGHCHEQTAASHTLLGSLSAHDRSVNNREQNTRDTFHGDTQRGSNRGHIPWQTFGQETVNALSDIATSAKTTIPVPFST
jgi:hypothetical protein